MKKIIISSTVVFMLFGCSEKITDVEKTKINNICDTMAKLDGYKRGISTGSKKHFKIAGIEVLSTKKAECVKYLTETIQKNQENKDSIFKNASKGADVAFSVMKQSKALHGEK